MYSLLLFAQNKLDPDSSGLPQVAADEAGLEKLFGLVFGVFAAVAVLVIVLAAIDFATGGGNAEKVGRARNTIIYAIVGLIISLSAEAIIFLVLNRL